MDRQTKAGREMKGKEEGNYKERANRGGEREGEQRNKRRKKWEVWWRAEKKIHPSNSKELECNGNKKSEKEALRFTDHVSPVWCEGFMSCERQSSSRNGCTCGHVEHHTDLIALTGGCYEIQFRLCHYKHYTTQTLSNIWGRGWRSTYVFELRL